MHEIRSARAHNGRHWHYLYRRHRQRQRALGINSKQMAWSQVISLVGSVIAGVLLESNIEVFSLLVGAFVVLPGVFDLDGSIGAALSAKINHRLENPDAKKIVVFIRSIGFALLIAGLGGLLVATLGGALAVWLFDASFWQIFTLSATAILLSAIVGFPLIAGLSILFRQLKVNPDDVVGPIESSVFDILTVITMAFVIGWLV